MQKKTFFFFKWLLLCRDACHVTGTHDDELLFFLWGAQTQICGDVEFLFSWEEKGQEVGFGCRERESGVMGMFTSKLRRCIGYKL